jgi:hypothetical protein
MTEVPPTSMRTSPAQRPPRSCWCQWIGGVYTVILPESEVRKMTEVPPTSMRTSPAQRPRRPAGVRGLVAFIESE